MATIITSIEDLAEHFETDVDHLKRTIYDETYCGAFIEWDDHSVCIGSIVEGSDAEFDQWFNFPVQSDTIDNWIEELEGLCDEAWHEANDDEEGED